MNSYPTVAIIILNWNTSHFLKQFLPSVLRVHYEQKEIYVIDNNSTDDSVAMMKSLFPGVRLLCMAENKGYATSYNFALSTIRADYYILLNSDIEVTENFIEPVIRLMEIRPEIGICQPKLLSLAEKQTFEYAGAAGGWIDRTGYPFARGRVLLTIEKDNGQYDAVQEIFWATGACMFLKKEVYNKIGGFYDYYWMHQEDIDLCWRAQKSGFKIFACPDSVVFHVGGGSLSWENHLKTFLTYRNNYILLSRNLAFSQSFPILLVRIIADCAGSVYFLFRKKQSGISKAMIKAVFAYFYWLFFYPSKGKIPVSGFKNMAGVYEGSILFPYFFNNRRKFSDIVHPIHKVP
jgi:GT2 family glycosyltransferase